MSDDKTLAEPQESKPLNRVQMNARVVRECKLLVKADVARREGLTIDQVVETIVTNFFEDFPKFEDRDACYRAHRQTA